MYLKKVNPITSFIFFFMLVYPVSAETHLQYQSRGNRYEGIKPKPVSGYDIELISAMVDYQEKVEQMPTQFKVKFYLERPSNVYMTVRELDYRYYYWMDKILPQKSWMQGFDNIFEWPTQDVIQHLDDFKLYDLGAVVRLQNQEPSLVEWVAPVIFYHSQWPRTIKGYLFTFKTNGDAHLTWSMHKEAKAEPLSSGVFRRQRGGRPFTVRWDSGTAAAGPHMLAITGHFLDTNDPIDQVVHFYHQPVVR